MSRCPPELLDDLTDILAEIRAWPGIVEKKTGIFYVGRQPFLHFHLMDGGHRRADVKGPAGWVQVDLPRPATAAGRRALRRELRLRYRER